MKELIKPNKMEDNYKSVEQYEECGTYCEPPTPCNKRCSGGATNKAPFDDDEILF